MLIALVVSNEYYGDRRIDLIMVAPRSSNQNLIEIATKFSSGVTSRKQLKHHTRVTTKPLG
jgi:hypothetical protein